MEDDQFAKVAGRTLFAGLASGLIRTAYGVFVKGEDLDKAVESGFKAALVGGATTAASQSVAETLTDVDDNTKFATSLTAGIITSATVTGLLDDGSDVRRA